MIETERLILRPWRDADRAPFAAMGRDPEVMAWLGGLWTEAQSDEAVDRQIALQAERGHCFWALDERATGTFLGFCGLKTAPEGCGAVSDDIEIGWRLRRDAWGRSYAREAAAASLVWGFANLPVPRIMAMTVIGNTRSWGLMGRLGMTRRPDLDFLHPNLADGHPLKPHIVHIAERRDACP